MLRSILRKSDSFVRLTSNSGGHKLPKIVLCMGNEAADADSIISALCYAHLKQCEHNAKMNELSTIWVPLVCIERKELYLRREVGILLREIGLDLEDLICIDDCPFQQWLDNGHLSAALLDHNQISEKMSNQLASSGRDIAVEDIMDHHIDLGVHQNCQGSYRNIAFDSDHMLALVGSACTLLFESLEATSFLSKDVALLLLGVIALDTVNMDPTIGKGTTRDDRAIQSLNSIAGVDRSALFERLRDAKTDPEFWLQLSAYHALILDFKKFSTPSTTSIGISSILIDTESFLAKTDIVEAVQQYFDTEKVDILVAMAMISSVSGPRREMTLFSKNPERLSLIDQLLRHTGTVAIEGIVALPAAVSAGICLLELRAATDTIDALLQQGIQTVVYSQANIKMSRKQMAPIFQDIYARLLS